MYKLLDGKSLANKLKEELKEEISHYLKKGLRKPSLAVILVGENPASKIYVRKKEESCEYVGINSISYHLPEDTTEKQLLKLINELNNRDDVDGILVQLPLPEHINTKKIINSINPQKDVDGFHPLNVGKLATGIDEGVIPCTPLGIWIMLKHYDIEIFKKNVVIVGTSNIVGKPMGLIFLKNEEATITYCHKNTKNLKEHTKSADILIVAVGKPKLITEDMVKEGVVVVDVGINRLQNGKIVGDVDFDNVKNKAYAITPVPGGVGPLTVVSLLINTVSVYREKNGLGRHPLTII
ncbi:MAG: bifunctional methylenetetrahydrofolate dehydrogenase/methenyltetrahydrofolate cyclohydrolase FolD [Persephonella sp.]|nr:MAG: bifunctional methylenetetrahydrofolate dehydrogenase/methenyltetrahydrofolate cyclohydrolase FolD [Persephonella sp.]